MKRVAQVIDNVDPEKRGRIKVKVLPELESINDNSLPWAVPIQTYNAQDSFEQSIPSKDSYVLVEIDEVWKHFAYLDNRPYQYNKECIDNMYSCLDNVKGLKSKKDGSQPKNLTYKKNPEYLKFYDSETGEFGIVLSNGRYFYWSGKEDKKFIYGVKSNHLFEIDENGCIKCSFFDGDTEQSHILIDSSNNIEIKNLIKSASVVISGSSGNIDLNTNKSTINMQSGGDIIINNHLKVTK